MSSQAGGRIAALIVAGLAVVLTAGPALAAPEPTIPPDVAAAFSGSALRQTQEATAGTEAPDLSGAIRADNVHEVFRFSGPFLEGDAHAEPVVRSGQWLATIWRGHEVLGAVEVWKPRGGPAEWAGYSGNLEDASALVGIRPDEVLVVDEPTGSFYLVSGSTVRAGNPVARNTLSEPADLAFLQKELAAQAAQRQAADPDYVDPPGLLISLVAMALALGVAGAVVLRQRSRTHVPGV